MLHIDLNCDMGEGMGNEEALMPFISSANIACGYHAGSEAEMERVVDLCIKYDVAIGAHPSFYDKENFGRTAIQLPLPDIYSLVSDQLVLLDKIVKKRGRKIHHIKPHGALYNMAARQTDIAGTIALATKNFDSPLFFYGLSGSVMIDMAKEYGLQTVDEVFADRTYQPDASLTPRDQPNALITDEESAIQQVLQMIHHKSVTAANGTVISIQADTVCIHGDGKHAVVFARALYNSLQQQGIIIKKITH